MLQEGSKSNDSLKDIIDKMDTIIDKPLNNTLDKISKTQSLENIAQRLENMPRLKEMDSVVLNSARRIKLNKHYNESFGFTKEMTDKHAEDISGRNQPRHQNKPMSFVCQRERDGSKTDRYVSSPKQPLSTRATATPRINCSKNINLIG